MAGNDTMNMFVHSTLRWLASWVIGGNVYSARTLQPTSITNARRYFVRCVTEEVRLEMEAEEYSAFLDILAIFSDRHIPYGDLRRRMLALLDTAEDTNLQGGCNWEVVYDLDFLEERQMLENPKVAIPVVLFAILFFSEWTDREGRRSEQGRLARRWRVFLLRRLSRSQIERLRGRPRS